MFTRSRTARAPIATFLVVALTVATVAVSLLDLGRDPGALAFSEAGSTTGYVEHHHGVCLQHSAAAWSPATGADLPSELLVETAGDLDDTAHFPGLSQPTAHHSRAPPIA